VFLGARHIEALRHNQRLSGALTAVTAAVVGVIANRSVFFSIDTVFADTHRYQAGPIDLTGPVRHIISPRALTITALAFVLVFRYNSASYACSASAPPQAAPSTSPPTAKSHPARTDRAVRVDGSGRRSRWIMRSDRVVRKGFPSPRS
jgi:hypothetical protein